MLNVGAGAGSYEPTDRRVTAVEPSAVMRAHRPPGMLLDPGARHACSAWSFVDDAALERFTAHLARDLTDGTWDRKHPRLRDQPTLDGSLVLVIADPH